MNWILEIFTDARGYNYYKKRLIFKCLLNMWATFIVLICPLFILLVMICELFAMLIMKIENCFNSGTFKNIISKVLNK